MKISAVLFLFIASLASVPAATTINVTNRYSYGANFGWADWRGDTNSSAVIGDYVCSGYIYSANVGWIDLGNGSPANGVRYQNVSGSDCGVNQDGLGNLSGYAYGANIGWVNFESTGAPKVNLATGNLSGYAWSANCGWISLSNAVARVQTDTLYPGLVDINGLPLPWQVENFGSRGVDANADPDGDGATNLQEYLAGTNPNDANDYLRITFYHRSSTYNTMAWTAKPTRFYEVQRRTTLDNASSWSIYFTFTTLGGGNIGFDDFGDQNYYRVRAIKPLSP
jgi:hypothetical protein